MLEFFQVKGTISITIKEVYKNLSLSNLSTSSIISQEINKFLSSKVAISASVNSVEESSWVVVLKAWQFLSKCLEVTLSSAHSNEEIS